MAARSVCVTDVFDKSPITSFHIKVYTLCLLVIILDGFDLVVIGVTLPKIAQYLHASPTALGLAVGAGQMGPLIGAMMIGMLSDRWGRKKSLFISALIFGLFTMLTTTVGSVPQLALFRFLAGIGLGGAIPNALALGCEYAPSHRRAFITGMMWAGMPLGSVIAAFAAAWLLPHHGWQSLFWVGGIPPIVVGLMVAMFLPESLAFLVRQGKDKLAIRKIISRISPAMAGEQETEFYSNEKKLSGVPVKHLFTEGRAFTTIAVWMLFFLSFYLLWVMLSWTPTLLRNAGASIRQYSVAYAFLVPLYPLFTLAVIVSALLGGQVPGLISSGLSLLYIYVGFQAQYFPLVGRRLGWMSLLAFALIGMSVSFTIGALRGSQRALRHSRDRYRSLFESIDEGFCVIEVLFDQGGKPNDWRYLEVNPAFERHNGLNHATGKTILELVPRMETRWFDVYGKVAITGNPVRFVDFAESLDRWFDLYAFRVGEPEQHRVAILFTNITERKLAEDALLRNEKLAATGRMAATIAHEVNNPLEGAMNALFLVANAPELKAETKKLVTMADNELRRAAHITKQTLGFCRENGSQDLVELPKVIDGVLTMYAGKLQSRNLTVRRRYKCGSCREGCDGCFYVNAGELSQIVSNLLANGIDALPDGGTMQIRVVRLSHPSRSEPRIQLTIADDGHGIRTEHLKRIFEPFFTTRKDFGTGLGLWVTQELVRKYNGSIKVRSREGKGTAFRLSFPAVPTLPKQPDRQISL